MFVAQPLGSGRLSFEEDVSSHLGPVQDAFSLVTTDRPQKVTFAQVLPVLIHQNDEAEQPYLSTGSTPSGLMPASEPSSTQEAPVFLGVFWGLTVLFCSIGRSFRLKL